MREAARQRGHGYAGSAIAALCERIFAEGKTAACLYAGRRNPYSNRCYAKFGFKRHCDSWHYFRYSYDPAAARHCNCAGGG
jgi:predicted GNAT family acetyltransferase